MASNPNGRRFPTLLAILLGALLAVGGSPDLAIAQTAERSVEKAAAAQMFRDYIDAFSRGVSKEISPFYDVPVALVFPMAARSLATADEIEKWLDTIRAEMRKRGVDSVAIDELNVKILGKSIALLSSSYRRLAKDGQILERGASTYLLRRTDQGWKIAAVTAHPPEDTVKLD